MPTDFDRLKREIAARSPELSPRLRQLAEFALRNPHDMALETIAVIAERAKVPPSSLIRFAQAFGYDGFSAMQRVFRSQLIERTTDYAERIQALRQSRLGDTPDAVLDNLVGAGIRALEHLRGTIRRDRLEEGIDLLAGAEAVHVVGTRRAFPVASYLAYALGQLGCRTQLLDGVGGLILQQANLITERDVLLGVSFTPYAPETLAVAERAAEARAAILAVTDGPLSPLLPLARVAFEVEDAELEGFRSLSATMCLALALVVRLGQRLDARGRPVGARPARGRGRAGRSSGRRPETAAAPVEPVG